MGSGEQAPRTLSLLVARGFRFDPRARRTSCSEEQRSRLSCPEASRIGTGTADGEATYLLQRFPFQATIDVFLAQKVQRGDLAGIAMVVREQRSGQTRSGRGRLLPILDPAYGLELRFDALPATQAPPGASAELTRLQLTIGAQRTVRRKRIVRRRGKRRRVVRRVRYNLIRNPRACAGTWPYRVRATFQTSEEVRDGSVACTA